MSRVLLTENIHPDAADAFTAAGFEDVERLEGALDDEGLKAAVGNVQLLGIRSRTQVRAEALEAARELLALGCFCIGTNQVDLDVAERLGVPVFNAPFANSRSVAELTLAAAIFLLRRTPEKMFSIRRGEWRKAARGSYEARAKKLGIVGYGNIGSQLSVLASGLGMHVYFYDIEAKLRHGNARAVGSLDELLEISDVVTLHVPSTPQTRGMIDARALSKMKTGAALINYARGDLVDIDSLAVALTAGRLAGAAIDVFPKEPGGAEEEFLSPLRELDNVILTPHVGGSTQEAQQAIGEEVAEKLIAYVYEGATAKAVNFPEVALAPLQSGRVRLAHVHRNVPGVLAQLNDIFSGEGLNIVGQALGTTAVTGYVLTDVEGALPDAAIEAARAIEGTTRVRVLKPR
ncbi:MAG: phosphoglycerate dehydrogenase [Maricaulaceae bacterium]|jgi:D-3-phosphoglycerate dehydrogenase